ncbi:BAG domain protein [Ceratobasidium sp. AG-Ba]|nr:BAG domain protein [Ceratobasidium sp. AG-Ba]
MLVFASPIPSAFSGIGALQPRTAPRPSAEEQYFLSLAEEHERAAAHARQRLQQVQRARKQQQDALEAQIRFQQQLAASLQVRTPQRSPYHTPARHAFSRALPLQDMNMILEFDPEDNDSCDAYAERMHRRTQERQRRAEEEAALRALFEEQRRAQAERAAELHRRRVQEAQAQREVQQKQARQQLEARAAEEQKLRQFFQALTEAMKAQSEPEGADLERKNAIRRNTAPVPVETPAPAPAPASAPVSPEAPVRSASPAPSTSSDASDASLHSIAHLQEKYDTLRAGFTFPSDLVFAPALSSPAASPSLMYNPTNAPVHAYENALTKLLTELDAVESFGDEHVRDVRRTLARNVEAELETLEERKRAAWRKQQDATPVVESTPVAAPAPEVESVPAPSEVESTPAPVESAPAAESSPVDPLAWLSSRLAKDAQPEEDDEVKAVRENLLARLAPLAPAFEPAPITDPAPAEPAVEVAPVQEPAAVEDSPKSVELAEQEVASEPAEEPAVASIEPEAELAPAEPEVELTPVTAPEPESEPAVIESAPAEAEAVPAPVSEALAEPTATTTEAAAVPELAPAEDSPAPASEAEPTPVPESEPDSTTEAELESVSSISEPEIVAPVPESTKATTFVQVFPESESDSDAETDGDLASELADRKSADEFEMI